jgi:hypothetical protein
MCPIKKRSSVAKRSPKKRMLEVLIKSKLFMKPLGLSYYPKN